MNLGEKIKKYRIKKGLTQQQLAEAIGVQRAAISKYEKDSVDISVERIESIAKALDTPIYKLVGGFGALDSVLPQNMQGANLDGAKIDIKFLRYMILRLAFLKNTEDYNITKSNVLAIAQSSELTKEATELINLIENNMSISETLMNRFNTLNKTGKEKAIDYITDLSEQEKYTKPDEEE